MKKRLMKEVFKLNELGFSPVDLSQEEWLVVKSSLEAYHPKTPEERRLSDEIKKKIEKVTIVDPATKTSTLKQTNSFGTPASAVPALQGTIPTR